jgi:Flp pilus assembly protein protease CpaA
MMPVMLVLLLYTLALSLYDLRTGKVPNWVTLPLLIAGIVAHFPGTFPVWIACLFVFLAWHSGQMGAGDSKLWMALFWAIPLDQSVGIPPVLFASLLGTVLLQLVFRKLTGRHASGMRTPAAWRTVPFILWNWYVH